MESNLNVMCPTQQHLSLKEQAQSLAEHINYAQRFIPLASIFTKVLSNKFRKNKKFIWTFEDTKLFLKLKNIVKELGPLRVPKLKEKLVIETDTSYLYIWGAVMRSYETNEIYRYCSRCFHGAELNYHISELEALAVLRAIKVFELDLVQNKFVIRTDNTQVKALLTNKDSNSLVNKRIIIWQLMFSYSDYEFEKIKGKNNVFAKFLSRNKLEDINKYFN